MAGMIDYLPDGYRVSQHEKHWYACVLCDNGNHFWHFAWHHRPYRTEKGARDACAKHRKIWEQVVELSQASGNRLDRLTKLVARSRGRRPANYRELVSRHAAPDPLTFVPVWATPLDPKFLKLLTRARTNCLAEEMKARLARG